MQIVVNNYQIFLSILKTNACLKPHLLRCGSICFFDVIDEEIKVASWYHLNGEIASFSDVAVSFGLSCGTMADIVFLYFHYKYLNSKTKLIMYLPSMSSKLHPEIEECLSVKGKNFEYVNSFSELKEKLLYFKKNSSEKH